VRAISGAGTVYAERVAGGRYIDIDVDRSAAARLGLGIDAVHEVVDLAIGGQVIGQTVEGRERYPINMRYPQQLRDSIERIRVLPIVTAQGSQITLGDVARIRVTEGPSMIRSENARPAGWIYLTPSQGDVAQFVREAQRQINAAHVLPPGYTLRWVGQYEYLMRAFGRLLTIVPITLAVIVVLLYLAFRRLSDVLLILGSLPVALVGGAWMLWLLGYRMSVATAVGLIALAGVAAETGVVMLIYLNTAWSTRRSMGVAATRENLHAAIVEGALLRLRPKLMTVTALLAGLLPLMFGDGAGSELMKRIAAPMIGGMLSATALTLLVIPALFLLVHFRSDVRAQRH
jgi:Cu(I)/Ag(I) efflux system membrane protein CusA/SilA